MAQETVRTVAVGIFDDRTSLERALGGLRDAGFSDDQIGVLHRTDSEGEATDPDRMEPATKDSARAGAVAGGVMGGVAGALLAGLIPGIGPALAGGILAGVLGGAAIGAAGGVTRTLLDLGIPEEDSRLYEQQFAAGRSILAVKAGDRYGEAVGILRGAGASISRLEAHEQGARYVPGDPKVVVDSGVMEDAGVTSPGPASQGWDDEEPAIRFGFERATAPNRHTRWADAEPTLRGDWEAEHPDTPWETVADLVRQGWERGNSEDRGIGDRAA